MRTVIVHAATTAIAHTGSAVQILPGRYEVVEVEGATERGELYVTSTAGTVVRVDPNDPNITVRPARRRFGLHVTGPEDVEVPASDHRPGANPLDKRMMPQPGDDDYLRGIGGEDQ